MRNKLSNIGIGQMWCKVTQSFELAVDRIKWLGFVKAFMKSGAQILEIF
jgi:hypothetical protein